MKNIFFISAVGLMLLGGTRATKYSSSEKCNGSNRCSTCTNCSRCEHCAKLGGTCGVCR